MRCAVDLEALSAPEAPAARLLAGRIAAALHRVEADEHFAAVALRRRRGPALQRAGGWLAEALRASALGDDSRTLHACRCGLRVLDQRRSMLGSPELQARAAAHGTEFAQLALGIARAFRATRPADAVERAVARHHAPASRPVRPPVDPELREELSALRETVSRLAAARAEGMPTQVLERENLRLERAVRARSLHAGGGSPIQHEALPLSTLMEQLGDDQLVELVEVDERLHVVVLGRGRIQRFVAGPAAEAAKEVDVARFWLTRLAHGVTTASAEEVLGTLEGIAKRCADLLLGSAATDLVADAITVVPSGRLHSVPWSMLPVLRDRDVAVSPSASLWSRSRTASLPQSGPVVLVRGPGLAERNEIEHLRRLYPGATCWTGPPRPRIGCCAPSTVPRWSTSRHTVPSVPTARSSPPCASPTAR